jgi:predicted dinucleotide-binding enzyme
LLIARGGWRWSAIIDLSSRGPRRPGMGVATVQIGIIGAGKIGSTLARQFARAGDDVAIANSGDLEMLWPLAEESVGDIWPATVGEAARFGRVLVLAIPFGRIGDLPAAEMAGKVVIDATNYYPNRDGHVDELDAGRATSSELVARQLPGSRVVKSFNAMRWDHLREFGRSAGAEERYGIPVSSDDNGAKRLVFDLIEQIGYAPVNAGSLAVGGRKHQPGAPAYLADLTADDLQAALA